MHCTSCGKLLPPEATTCPACGTPISSPASAATQVGSEAEFIDAEATQLAVSGSFQETVPHPQLQEPQQTPDSPDLFSSPTGGIDKHTTGYGPAYLPPPADPQTPQPFYAYQQPQFSPAPAPAPLSPQTQPPIAGMPPISPVPPGRFVPAPTPIQSNRGLSKGMMILLVALAVLLIIAGSGLIYYSTVYHPAQLHTEATATVQAIYTQQAHMTATANAEATSTAIAVANATATANAQATAQAVATATALANIYTQATSGTPALDDALSYPNNWANEYGSSRGGCNFSAGAYHITEPSKGYFLFCPALGSSFSNLAFQVNIDIIAGDFAGIGIRDNESTGSAYYFTIYTDGTYDLSVWKNRNGDDSRSLQSGNSSSIKVGHNQINLVTIIARNHTFYLYVNKHFIASAQDSSFSSGEIGLFAGDQTHSADVAFSNARAWRL
jgi:zinc-ribbon domain